MSELAGCELFDDEAALQIWVPGASPDLDDPIYKASGNVEGGQVKIHRP